MVRKVCIFFRREECLGRVGEDHQPRLYRTGIVEESCPEGRLPRRLLGSPTPEEVYDTVRVSCLLYRRQPRVPEEVREDRLPRLWEEDQQEDVSLVPEQGWDSRRTNVPEEEVTRSLPDNGSCQGLFFRVSLPPSGPRRTPVLCRRFKSVNG